MCGSLGWLLLRKQECSPCPEAASTEVVHVGPDGLRLPARPEKAAHTWALHTEQQGSQNLCPFRTTSHAPSSTRVCSFLRSSRDRRQWSRSLVFMAPQPGPSQLQEGKSKAESLTLLRGLPSWRGLTRGHVLTQSGHFCSPAPHLWGRPPAPSTLWRTPGPVLLLDSYLWLLPAELPRCSHPRPPPPWSS